MSSLLECLEWEHTFALDANQPFNWMQWIEQLVQIAKLPVYNIYSFCDAAAVFDMAQHAKYYNGDLDLQPMTMCHVLQKHMNTIGLNKYCQKQYFMQALCNFCGRYTIGITRVPCPDTQHMSNVPVIPFLNFTTLHKILNHPHQLYAWLKNVVVNQSEQPFHTTIKLKIKTNVSGRRKRKQEIIAASLHASERIVSSLMEQFEEIKTLSPQFAPLLTCTSNLCSARELSITLHAKQQYYYSQAK